MCFLLPHDLFYSWSMTCRLPHPDLQSLMEKLISDRGRGKIALKRLASHPTSFDICFFSRLSFLSRFSRFSIYSMLLSRFVV